MLAEYSLLNISMEYGGGDSGAPERICLSPQSDPVPVRARHTSESTEVILEEM